MGSLYATTDEERQSKGGFYCKKHRLTMFSLNYCPICVSERIHKKEAS